MFIHKAGYFTTGIYNIFGTNLFAAHDYHRGLSIGRPYGLYGHTLINKCNFLIMINLKGYFIFVVFVIVVTFLVRLFIKKEKQYRNNISFFIAILLYLLLILISFSSPTTLFWYVSHLSFVVLTPETLPQKVQLVEIETIFCNAIILITLSFSSFLLLTEVSEFVNSLFKAHY